MRGLTMNEIIRLFKNKVRKFGMIIALFGIIFLFQILIFGFILTPLNITNIIMNNSYISILAISMMCVNIVGEIVLSVGSVAAFIVAVSGVLLVVADLPIYLGIILCLVLGAIIGAWQGFWVAYVKIPSFIVTLAGMLIFRALTLVVLQGRTIAPFPSSFRGLSSSFLPDVFSGGEVKLLTIFIGLFLTIIFVI